MPKPNRRIKTQEQLVSEATWDEGLPSPKSHRRAEPWKTPEPPTKNEPDESDSSTTPTNNAPPPSGPASTKSTPPPSGEQPAWMPSGQTYPAFLVETCERMLLCLRIESETVAMDSFQAQQQGKQPDPGAPLAMAMMTIAEAVCHQMIAAASLRHETDLLLPPSGLTDPRGNPI